MNKFVARYPAIFDLFWNNVEWYSDYLRQFIDRGYCQDEREYLEITQELGRCNIYLELLKKEGKNDS